MKKEYILIGAAALGAAYIFLSPKGEGSGPGSTGGLGAGLGGLPGVPGTGGGGSDTPTVNIDFPNIPPFIVPEETPLPGETKKEASASSYNLEEIWSKAISRGYTYDPSKDMLTKDLGGGQTGHYGKTSWGTGGSWYTKKEKVKDERVGLLDRFNAFGFSLATISPSTTRSMVEAKVSGSTGSKEISRTSPTPHLTKKEQTKIDYTSRGYSYAGSSGGVSVYGSTIPGGLSSTLASAMKAQGVTSVRY